MADFGWALSAMREGSIVRRIGWNRGLTIRLMWDPWAKAMMPFFYEMHPVKSVHWPKGETIPWKSHGPDILAMDWELFPMEGVEWAKER